MPGNPKVLDLLEVILDLGKTPEEACRECPDLLPEVQQRWQQFRRLDGELVALFPGIQTAHGATPIPCLTHPVGLPQVPGYEVEALLGRGGMGVVYKARHLALKRTVALKMLAVGNPYPAERARFRAEAEAVARLQHPNIVQIHEIGEADGRPFFALEYVAGGSLAERLVGQSLPPEDAARLVAALAEAMHLAHSRNLVHRDLKPGNVLLAGAAGTPVSQCHPKVTDFGLVRQLDADSGQTCDGVVIGTPSYMAPEQAEGRAGSAGPAADVYALGAILYECLTGRPPFGGATAQEILMQVRSREPVPPTSLNPQTPRDLETICLKCLRKEPERRYSSARELADDLGRFVRGEPVMARPVSRLERGSKWVRRNPTVAALSTVAALALVTGSVVSLLFGIEASQKAEELRQKTIQLEAETREARKNGEQAKDNEKKTEQALVTGLLIPIGGNRPSLTSPLEATEVAVMRQLRSISPELRLRFVETALRDSETARRVGRRGDWVVQAIVGDDGALRAEMVSLVIRRIQEPGAPPEVRLACARLGLALNVTDRLWAEHAADALLVALRDPKTGQTDFPSLAAALSAVCEQLSPAQAAKHEASALDFLFTFLKLPVNNVRYYEWLQGIEAISSRLDPATAARAAETLTTQFCHAECDPSAWYYLSQALVAVCRRLPASQADVHINRTIDFLITKRSAVNEEKQKTIYYPLSQALAELCPPHPQPAQWEKVAPARLIDPARASRVADAAVAIFGDTQDLGNGSKFEFTNYLYILPLTQVAKFLDAPDALRAAERVVLAMRNAKDIGTGERELRLTLAILCRRLDATGLKRVAEAIIAAVQDPKTMLPVHLILADTSVIVAGQLSPAEAASLEGVVVDSLLADLGDPKDWTRGYVGKALGTAAGRPGATRVAQVADALYEAIRNQQTPVPALEELTAALVAVCAQLPPREAAGRRERTLAELDSRWNASTAPTDRALLVAALAVLWPHLDRTAAAARAHKAAAYIDDAMRNPNLDGDEFSSLAVALPAVCSFLEPEERRRQANSSAEVLLGYISSQKPRNIYVAQTLATISLDLDQASVVRLADTLFALMEESKVQRDNFESVPTTDVDPVLKKIAVRLDERNLRRLLAHPLAVGGPQRILLDALPGSQKRSFRNLWHYLDSAESNGN